MGDFGDSLRSPTKSSGTSRVIESLHERISSYSQSLEESKLELNEYKRKYNTVQKRLDSVTDQLENSKYQHDTVSSMLKRKERKITDLELELTDTTNRLATAEAEIADLKKQLSDAKLKESQERNELQRITTAYETISEGQESYRSHYEREINRLRTSFDVFVLENQRRLQENVDSLSGTDTDLGKAFSILKTDTKKLERMRLRKDESVTETLRKLASEARKHETQIMKVLIECEDAFRRSNFDLAKFPNITGYKKELIEVLEAEGIDTRDIGHSKVEHEKTIIRSIPHDSLDKKRNERKNSINREKRNATGSGQYQGIDIFNLRIAEDTPSLSVDSTTDLSEPSSFSFEKPDASYDSGQLDAEQTAPADASSKRKQSGRRRQRKRKPSRKVSQNE
ncbi:BA75_03875T0 [Komagataella pastoris]|uniref:SWI5-dependent HO expression protein 3 n=1 Tax=Komagataella pastoris TaxID=4922 RepID=A0A1B2JEW2_PICPA|nr:BA75_03875T0 [Komagataella pastoris]